MNPYLIGGAIVAFGILGWQLKSSIQRNGELEVRLETQVAETRECTAANGSNMTTITALQGRIETMVEERRIDTERREEILVQRDRELAIARADAAKAKRERRDEIESSQDCADFNSLRMDTVCPDGAVRLRERSQGNGSN